MKKRILLLLLVFLGAGVDAECATARRAASVSGASVGVTAKRATTNTRATSGARAAKTTATAQKNVAARAATNTRGVKSVGTAPVQKTVAARAGTTQKVISSGTKVSVATENKTLDKTCQEKYNGCMDSFCMLDNTNGGRCMCSDKHADLNAALAEIERVDEMSYRMATQGVEQLEMGADAAAVVAMAQGVTDSIMNPQKKNDTGKLDFSAWDVSVTEAEDIFGAKSQESDSIEDKTGDALYKAVSDICKAQIPECNDAMSTIQLLYAQQVKSDCLAYENTIKKKRSESNTKLQAAERALREVALEQQRSVNKYDLPKCVIKFRECMQTTGGCGDDFTGCASVIATDNVGARANANDSVKKFTIQGEVSNIVIAASTYETLLAKKTLCESVTKNCVDVAGQVWDAFLRESAKDIKSAELIVEDKARQNCSDDISACFQKACKDTMDPNDPDGSYDMCLSRPETMLNVCRVPLNACGIDATSKATAKKSDIWQYVLKRLAAIRVNACNAQVKECLQSNDACGTDYSKCIGLDRDAVLKMCPLEKLTACDSSSYGNNDAEIQNYVYNVAAGLMLNVDNSLQRTCENAARNKIIEICGSATSCYLNDGNANLGLGSLQVTQDTDNTYVISGLVDFDAFDLSLKDGVMPDDYVKGTAYTIEYEPETLNSSTSFAGDAAAQKRVGSVVKGIGDAFKRKMSLLANDPTINMCITGRNIEQITGSKTRTTARIPNLLEQYSGMIFGSLLNVAAENYSRAYATELSKVNSKSQEYRNVLMCYAMAELSGEMGNKIPENVKTRYGIQDRGTYFERFSGASTQDLLDAQSRGVNKTRNVSVDGNMIATEELSAVYEPGPQVCRLTSRLYACTGYEAIYEGHSESVNVGLNANVGVKGVSAGGGMSVGTSSSDTTHGGNFCNSFAEPVISEQIISFATGEAVFGNVTRSNMQSQYSHNSNTSNIEDNSWGISLSAGVSTGSNVTNNIAGNLENQDVSTTNNTALGKNATIGDNNTINDNDTLNYRPRNNTTTSTETGANTAQTRSSANAAQTRNSANSGGGFEWTSGDSSSAVRCQTLVSQGGWTQAGNRCVKTSN